jgi:hypothetical protein
MAELAIERVGGVAGFGGPHLKSRGTVDLASLSASDQAAVTRLFETGGAQEPAQGIDGFLYRITRQTHDGPQTIQAPEHVVPMAIAESVRDVLD